MSIDKAWEAEVTEMWGNDIAEGYISPEILLEWWPTREAWEQFEREAKESEENSKIIWSLRHHFFDEDEFERLMKRFARGEASARRQVFGLLSDPSQRAICVRAINALSYRPPDEKKIIRAFKELLKTKAFNDEVLEIRKKIAAPESGHPWRPHALAKEEETPGYNYLYNECLKLAQKYGLDHGFAHSLMYHVVFDKVPVDALWLFKGLCFVEDVEYAAQEPPLGFFSDDKEEDATRRRQHKKDAAELRRRYPIAIRVSPYATTEDIQRFISRNRRPIRDQLAEYRKSQSGSLVGKVRQRLAGKKFDFIWNNQSVRPARVLAGRVNKKFGTAHDHMYIRATISRLNKERGRP